LVAWGFWAANGFSKETLDIVKNLATTGGGAFIGLAAFMLRPQSNS
jgi:hypothetical protein